MRYQRHQGEVAHLDLLLPVYLPNSSMPLDEQIGCGMNDKMAAMDLRVVSLRIGIDAGLYMLKGHTFSGRGIYGLHRIHCSAR